MMFNLSLSKKNPLYSVRDLMKRMQTLNEIRVVMFVIGDRPHVISL